MTALLIPSPHTSVRCELVIAGGRRSHERGVTADDCSGRRPRLPDDLHRLRKPDGYQHLRAGGFNKGCVYLQAWPLSGATELHSILLKLNAQSSTGQDFDESFHAALDF